MILQFTAMLLLLSLFIGTNSARAQTDVQEFWNRFRKAALNGEVEEVATMTRFPLWVRGLVDSDPVIYYGDKDFRTIWNTLLNQQVVTTQGGQTEIKTMLQVIREKKIIAPRDFPTPKVFRVELFRFDKIKGHWFLVRAYLEAPP